MTLPFYIDYGVVQSFTMENWVPLEFSSKPVQHPTLAEQLNDFASTLAANQQELGADFAKVLNENRWDLYNR